MLIVVIWLWTLVLFLLSRRALGSGSDPDEDARDKFLWVFLVPALNEEVTIADSVSRLLAVEARNKAILVIDDGSTDGTAAVLDAFDTPELEVLHRVAPRARQGEARGAERCLARPGSDADLRSVVRLAARPGNRLRRRR